MYTNSLSVETNRLLTSYRRDVVEYLNVQSHRTTIAPQGLGISAPNSIDPRRQCSLPNDRKFNRLIKPEDTCIHVPELELNNPRRF